MENKDNGHVPDPTMAELKPNHSRLIWRHRLRLNRRLLTLKFLIFLMNGATNVLYPFFIIHCLSMGLTLTESGIVFALIPVFGSFGNPLAGFLADKLGNYKKVVISFILLSVLCHALLGFAVPIYSSKRVPVTYSLTTVSFDMKCSENSTVHLNLQHSPSIPEIQEPPSIPDIQGPPSISDTHGPPSIPKIQGPPSIPDIQGPCSVKFSQSRRGLTVKFCESDCEADQAVCMRPVSNRSSQLDCFSWKKLAGKELPHILSIEPIANSSFWTVTESDSSIESREPTLFIVNRHTVPVLTCPRNALLLRGCSVRCALEAENILLTCQKTLITGNRATTFVLYTLFRVIGAMAVSSVMMLIDSATILMVKEHKGDFGVQRTFGIIGSLVFPPLGGYLVGVASAANKQQDYSPIFYLFCSMFTVGAVITWFMDLHIKPPGKEIWSNVWRLLRNVKVSSFVIVMFLIGCFFGILENYLFWYMQTFLASPKWLLGMTNTVAGLSAIPVVAASSFIIRYVGHTKIFMMSLILYGARFLAYSFVHDPYLILPVEVLEAFTFSLTFVTATIYSGKVAPAFVATLQGLVGAMHYSVGRGLGSLIAGTLFDHLPPRLVYQIVAAASAGCGLIYAILHYLWLRHAPDPKIDIGHSEFTQTAAHTGSGETSNQLDQVHSALLETDHPNQIPGSTALFLEESGDEEEEHRKQGRL